MQTIGAETETTSRPATPPPGREDEISLLDLLIVLARRKRTIALGTMIIAAIAAVVSFLLPSKYTATTVILPPQNSSSASSMLLSQIGSLGAMAPLAGAGLGLKNPTDMYVAMIKSRTVEDAMVQRFGLMKEYKSKVESDARKAFENHSEVTGGTKDGLIHISATDRDPKRAAEMANGFVEEYQRLSGTLAITEAAQRRLFFEQQLVQAKDNLANAEEALKATQQKTGLIQLDSQARALIESAASLRGQIAATEVRIRAMRSYASEGNPELQLAQQQLAAWKAQLSQLAGNQSGSEDDLLVTKGEVPKAGLEYVRKLRDVKYYDTIFELLAKQFEMAKLDEARQGALIQVVDRAVSPDRRSSPKRTLIIVVAAFAGLFLSILWVLLQEGFQQLRKNPEEREKIETLMGFIRRRPLKP